MIRLRSLWWWWAAAWWRPRWPASGRNTWPSSSPSKTLPASQCCEARAGAGTFWPEPEHFGRSRNILAGAGTFWLEPGHFGRSRDILAGAGAFWPEPVWRPRSGSSLDEKEKKLNDILFLRFNNFLRQISKKLFKNKCDFLVIREETEPDPE